MQVVFKFHLSMCLGFTYQVSMLRKCLQSNSLSWTMRHNEEARLNRIQTACQEITLWHWLLLYICVPVMNFTGLCTYKMGNEEMGNEKWKYGKVRAKLTQKLAAWTFKMNDIGNNIINLTLSDGHVYSTGSMAWRLLWTLIIDARAKCNQQVADFSQFLGLDLLHVKSEPADTAILQVVTLSYIDPR